jgi:Tol biopolymer transport system component
VFTLTQRVRRYRHGFVELVVTRQVYDAGVAKLRAVLVVVGVASAGAASGGAATGPREILFVGAYGGRGDTVLAIRSDGTGLRPVALGYTPHWSPDGTSIVYAQSADMRGPGPTRGLAVVAGSGGPPLGITEGEDSWGIWSPNGRWIAFTRYESQKSNLYIVRPDGRQLRKLHESIRGVATWSPDSRRLLIRYRTGLTTIDLAGRTRWLPNARCAGDGAWSPNGRWIAFAKCVETLSHLRLAIEHPDGSGFSWLTRTSDDFDPAWAPDSSRLAYVHFRQIGYLEHTEVRMISIGRKMLGSLFSSAQDHDASPQWSPDGRQIVFDRDAAGEPIGEADRLYVGDAKTGHVRKLYDDTARGMQSWRPW